MFFLVDVAVIYFMYLICICVLAVVLTIIVQHLQLRSETKPFVAMPMWVSTNYIVPKFVHFIRCSVTNQILSC